MQPIVYQKQLLNNNCRKLHLNSSDCLRIEFKYHIYNKKFLGFSQIEYLYNKHFTTYRTFDEAFTTCNNFQKVGDYLVAKGIILNQNLDLLALICIDSKYFRGHNNVSLANKGYYYKEELIKFYITPEILQDKKLMKYFGKYLNMGFKTEILSIDKLDHLTSKKFETNIIGHFDFYFKEEKINYMATVKDVELIEL